MCAADTRDKHCSVAPVCVLGSWTACAIIDLDLDSPDRARSTSTSSVATRDRAHTETRARWQISAAIEKEPSGNHKLREAHVHCRLTGDLRSREAPFHRERAVRVHAPCGGASSIFLRARAASLRANVACTQALPKAKGTASQRPGRWKVLSRFDLGSIKRALTSETNVRNHHLQDRKCDCTATIASFWTGVGLTSASELPLAAATRWV